MGRESEAVFYVESNKRGIWVSAINRVWRDRYPIVRQRHTNGSHRVADPPYLHADNSVNYWLLLLCSSFYSNLGRFPKITPKRSHRRITEVFHARLYKSEDEWLRTDLVGPTRTVPESLSGA